MWSPKVSSRGLVVRGLVRSCCAVGHFEEAMALVYEALGLTGRPRSFIDKALVEELLATLLRRGEARRLGLPFLARLQVGSKGPLEALVARPATSRCRSGWRPRRGARSSRPARSAIGGGARRALGAWVLGNRNRSEFQRWRRSAERI